MNYGARVTSTSNNHLKSYVLIPLDAREYHFPLMSTIQNINDAERYRSVAINICVYVPADEDTTTDRGRGFLRSAEKSIQFFMDTFPDHVTSNGNPITDIVNVRIALNRDRKRFPTSNTIDLEHVNNGSTTFWSDGRREIFVYRSEDMNKVLLHELIHCFRLDLPHKISLKNPFIRKNFPYLTDASGAFDLTEAYTETLACYLHIMHAGLDLREYAFRFSRTARALVDHCARHPLVTQNSHMFSYYICKALLFAKIDRFLELFFDRKKDALLRLMRMNHERMHVLDSATPLRSMASFP